MILRRSPRRQSSSGRRSVWVTSYQCTRSVAFARELIQRTLVSQQARSRQHLAVLGLALCVSAPVQAAEKEEGELIEVVLEYDSPPSCSTAADFRTALQGRSSRIVLVDDRSSSTLMRVSIRPSADGVVGELQLVQGARPSDPRFVKSSDCANVVNALALTAALSLAPRDRAEPALNELSEPSPWEVRVGARAEAAKVVESHFGLGGGLWLSAERETSALWVWWLSVGGSFVTTRPLAGDFPARFELTAAHVWVCPLRFGSSQLFLRPCLNTQLGTLSGRGQNLADAREASSLWASVGPALILHYDPLRLLRLDVIAGAAIPMNPQDYTIDSPQTPVSSTTVVAPWLGLGLSYEL